MSNGSKNKTIAKQLEKMAQSADSRPTEEQKKAMKEKLQAEIVKNS